MSFAWVGWLALALVAAAFAVLYLLQRRQVKAVGQLSQEVQRIAIGGRLGGRVEVQAPSSEVSALTTAINHLLTRAAAGAERDRDRGTPKLFTELADRIH